MAPGEPASSKKLIFPKKTNFFHLQGKATMEDVETASPDWACFKGLLMGYLVCDWHSPGTNTLATGASGT